MIEKEHISKQIWKFLDGDGSDEDRVEIQRLIDSDRAWMNQYKDIVHVQNQLKELSAEQPTMRFTKNILEQLPSSKKTFVQPESLLSFKAKYILVSLFLLVAVISFTQYLPDLIGTEPGSKYLYIQSMFEKIAGVFTFKVEMNLYAYIILGVLMVIITDHFVNQWYWSTKDKSSVKQ